MLGDELGRKGEGWRHVSEEGDGAAATLRFYRPRTAKERGHLSITYTPVNNWFFFSSW